MSMQPRRQSSFLLADVEPDIHIRTHDKGEPLRAHHDVLKLFSGTARDLPREEASAKPTVWDLSQLALEGESQPVSSELAQLWLDLVYVRVDTSRRVASLPTSLDAVRPLLLFADAVGTSDAVMQDIGRCLCSNQGLTLKVEVVGAGKERKELQLSLEGCVFLCKGRELREQIAPRQSRSLCDGVDPAAVQLVVASALEEWLALAGRLHMVPLVRKLIAFAKNQMVYWHDWSILGPAAAQVLSPRVLKLLPPEILYEAVAWRFLQPEPSDMVFEQCEDLVAHGLPRIMSLGEKSEEVALIQDPGRRNSCKSETGCILLMNFSFGGPAREQLESMVEGVAQRALAEDEAGHQQQRRQRQRQGSAAKSATA